MGNVLLLKLALQLLYISLFLLELISQLANLVLVRFFHLSKLVHKPLKDQIGLLNL